MPKTKQPRARKLKCYWGNLDGQREGLVVAHNQKEAAKAIGTSMGDFRNFWSEDSRLNPDQFKSLTLYTRDFGDLYGVRKVVPWFEGRCPKRVD